MRKEGRGGSRTASTEHPALSTQHPSPATGRIDGALRAALPVLADEGLPPGTRVLVGVSGGQDSLCMVHALRRLRAPHGWDLHVVHVDHGIRAAAATEAAQVVAACSAWDLPVDVVWVDVPSYRRRERLNLQEAARYARYQAFAACGRQLGAAAVLVAHTADDVAETLLLHLLRGAGLDGLAASPPVETLPWAALGPPLNAAGADRGIGRTDGRSVPSGLKVGRPLLAVARADTGAYCVEQGLVPVGEPAGAYRRDRLRQELLPLLERYNPAVRRALAGAAEALAEERAALEAVADERWVASVRREHGALVFPLAPWAALPAAMQKRLLRRAITEMAGTVAGLNRRALAAALGLAHAQSGRGVDLPGGLRLEREPAALRLAWRDRGRGTPPVPAMAPSAQAASWSLPLPGAAMLPGLGTVRAERCATRPVEWPAADARECWLDATAVREPLFVRLRRPGDRFQPLGMDRPKRLQDFLVDARVPRAARGRLPLVASSAGIAWVIGYRIAEWARVRPDSPALLHLVFEPRDEHGGAGGADQP